MNSMSNRREDKKRKREWKEYLGEEEKTIFIKLLFYFTVIQKPIPLEQMIFLNGLGVSSTCHLPLEYCWYR
jgi:hypothetical protein